VDSTPIEIFKMSRSKHSLICSTEKIKPEFGNCAATKTHYFGYKLHALCDENAVMYSFALPPAGVHDVNYLKELKYAHSNSELIGDKGYIIADYQVDLFNQSQMKLSVPTLNTPPLYRSNILILYLSKKAKINY
jgi:hypothetical protein